MPDNDWVLPDPERLLSKHHCLIEQRSGAWVLTDTSTNGVYLDNSPVAVGPGGTAPAARRHAPEAGRLRAQRDAGSEAGQPASRPRTTVAAGKESRRDLFDNSWFTDKPLEAPAHPGPRRAGAGFLPTGPHALPTRWRSTCRGGPVPFGGSTCRRQRHRPAAEPAKPSPFLDLDWRGPTGAAGARRRAARPRPEPPPPAPAPPPTAAASPTEARTACSSRF